MKNAMEIFVSRGESVYQIIKKLKEEGKLESAWLITDYEVNQKMKETENAEIYVRRNVSLHLFMAWEVRYYRTERRIDVINIPCCEDPENIIFIKLKN